MNYNIDGSIRNARSNKANPLKRKVNDLYRLASWLNRAEKIVSGDIVGYIKTKYVRGKYRRITGKFLSH